jgi:hypothetical protein
VGTFNFNLARIIHALMAGNVNTSLQGERANVLFDTNNNRVFTVTDFAKDVLDRSRGKLNLSEIIEMLKEKYQLTYADAEFKSKNLLQDLRNKNIITQLF